MFTKITLKNYRTHKLTTLELGPVTLLIGNNNSGKSNLFAGLDHFAWLVRRANPQHNKEAKVTVRDYFPHRYRLAGEGIEPMSITIDWTTGDQQQITYEIELYKNDSNHVEMNSREGEVGCRERITIKLSNKESKEITSGYNKPSNLINLRRKIESDTSLPKLEKDLCRSFFRDFANIFSYHFQPAFLKGLASAQPRSKHNLSDNEPTKKENISIPVELGYYGDNFQDILIHTKEKEERTFSRFNALLRRFEAAKNFISVRPDNNNPQKVIWEFDLGRKETSRSLDDFPAEVVSDGILKAAVIALLISLRRPPTLTLLEEIENGINPGNIQLLIDWIWQSATPNPAGNIPQFILTSHSPSVLREFSEHLDNVYVTRLDKRRFQSDVRNLNTALETLIGIGSVADGEIIEDDQGKRLVKIPKYRLVELWHSGAIG